MPLHAIAYASQAVPDLSKSQLNGLVERAAARNLTEEVTGLLLFDGARFLQYIEGPEEGLNAVYARILNARSHTDLIELARGRIGRRRLPYWSMQRIDVAETDLKAAALSDWTSMRQRMAGSIQAPTGVDRLAELAMSYLSSVLPAQPDQVPSH